MQINVPHKRRDLARRYSDVAFAFVCAGAFLTCVAIAFAQRPDEGAKAKAEMESPLVVDGPAAWPNADWQADATMLAGLRGRSLYTVAEVFCREKLAREDLASRTRCELVLELSRTLAAHAVHSPPQARDELWSAASRTIDDYLRGHADHPRAIILRLQDALVARGRGELARHESELIPADATLPATAQKYLREAIGRLTVLGDDVAVALRNATRSSPTNADALSADELLALERNVRYQIAKAQQEIAETYTAGGNDRIDALAQADRLLEPLAAANSEDEVVWQARVDRVSVERKLGRSDPALARIEQLASKSRPAWVDARLMIERAMLSEGASQFDAALELLDADAIVAGGVDAGELDDLRLYVVLAAWRAAHETGDAASTTARQSQAATLVRRIDEQHEPYWSRRAKLRAAATIAAGTGTNDATLLASAAENFLHTGRADEAVRAYDRAAEAARGTGDDDLAFRLALTAAAVEQQRKRLEEAMTRYASLARGSPKHADAAKAHLQATWNAAHAFGPRSREYRDLIAEHLRLWSESATADDARLWLARALQGERKWAEAAAAYRQVRPTAAAFESAVVGAALCYDKVFARKATEKDAAAAAGWFEAIAVGSDGTWPATLSSAQRTAVTSAAKLRLRYVASSVGEAAAFLREAKTHAADAPLEWFATVALLEVESLAARGEFDTAEKSVHSLIDSCKANGASDGPADGKPTAEGVQELLAALAAMRTAKSNDRAAARRIAAVELSAGKLLSVVQRADAAGATKSTAASRRAVADALAAAGRRDEALVAYRKLANEFRGDAAVQRGYAALLSAGEDGDTLTAALEQWRLVESKSRPATAAWFAAKYEVASLHERLGDRRQALRVVTLLAALYPELGGEAMKAKFDALTKRCQQ